MACIQCILGVVVYTHFYANKDFFRDYLAVDQHDCGCIWRNLTFTQTCKNNPNVGFPRASLNCTFVHFAQQVCDIRDNYVFPVTDAKYPDI